MKHLYHTNSDLNDIKLLLSNEVISSITNIMLMIQAYTQNGAVSNIKTVDALRKEINKTLSFYAGVTLNVSMNIRSASNNNEFYVVTLCEYGNKTNNSNELCKSYSYELYTPHYSTAFARRSETFVCSKNAQGINTAINKLINFICKMKYDMLLCENANYLSEWFQDVYEMESMPFKIRFSYISDYPQCVHSKRAIPDTTLFSYVTKDTIWIPLKNTLLNNLENGRLQESLADKSILEQTQDFLSDKCLSPFDVLRSNMALLYIINPNNMYQTVTSKTSNLQIVKNNFTLFTKNVFDKKHSKKQFYDSVYNGVIAIQSNKTLQLYDTFRESDSDLYGDKGNSRFIYKSQNNGYYERTEKNELNRRIYYKKLIETTI
jgi:hypothetical protein